MAPNLQSAYDKPVLSLLAEHGPITLKVLTHRFTHRKKSLVAGKERRDVRHFIAMVKSLRDRGLAVQNPQHPRLGRASRQVLDITAAGWDFLQDLRLRPIYPADAPRAWLIARSALIVTYLDRGYTLAQGEQVFEALRADAVKSITQGIEREPKGLPLTLLRKAPGFDMSLEALVAPMGQVTLLFPAHDNESWKGRLKLITGRRTKTRRVVHDPVKRSGLLQVSAIHPLRFMIVATDAALERGATDGVRRWARRPRTNITTAVCPVYHIAGLPTRPTHAAHSRVSPIGERKSS